MPSVGQLRHPHILANETGQSGKNAVGAMEYAVDGLRHISLSHVRYDRQTARLKAQKAKIALLGAGAKKASSLSTLPKHCLTHAELAV